MKEINFTVIGKPKGKERPRHAKLPGGRVVTYTPKATKAYESTVREAFLDSGGEIFPEGVPLLVEITALMPIAKSTPKKRAADMESGLTPAIGKPDVDNLAKIALDALNHVAWTDDRQVTALVVRKRYDKRGSEGAMQVRISDISA